MLPIDPVEYYEEMRAGEGWDARDGWGDPEDEDWNWCPSEQDWNWYLEDSYTDPIEALDEHL